MEKIIIKTDDFKVKQICKSQFIIKFKNREDKLVKSLIKTRIIPGSITDENYELIKFKAESVKSLVDFMEDSRIKYGKKGLMVCDIVKMTTSLVTQLSYLLKEEFSTIIGYNEENIIVINNEKFAFLGSELIADFDEVTQMAMISCPFNINNFFASPELVIIKEIPAYIHYKTSYFSFGCLLLFALLGDDDFYKDFLTHNRNEPIKLLEYLKNHPIKNTRIYWLLSRCLVEEANNRSIIVI